MGERLYYADAYLREFDAEVIAAKPHGDAQALALNRSAFYPTSGGQPHDTGTLNGTAVRDVFVENGEVWHVVDGHFSVGEGVHGCIDWPRRFDHMQQHGGEHMIAGAVYTLTGGTTLGLHLGSEVSSIDVSYADASTHMAAETIAAVEDYVNRRIQWDVPIRCWFPDPEELARLPLRKKPTVDSHVRVVAMGDFEMVACGGTHPSSTGQIGLVKIVGAAPERGKLRLSFVCGQRAVEDYRKNFRCAWAAANRLSTRPELLEKSVLTLQQRLKAAERELGHLRREALIASMQAHWDGAESLPRGGRLVCARLDADVASARDFASKLIARGGVVVLLAVPAGERYNLIFARSGNLEYPMGKLLSETAAPLGGKGGGRGDFAQGGGPLEILAAARARLMEERE